MDAAVGGDQGADRLLNGIDVRVVGCGHLDLHPAGRVSVVVGNTAGGHVAVGNVYHFIVRGDQRGVGKPDGFDRAAVGAGLHIVTGSKGLADQNLNASGQIGKGILQGQGHRQTGHTQQSDQAGHIHSQAAQNDQRRHKVQHHPQAGLQKSLQRAVQPALAQHLGHHAANDLHGDDAHQHREHHFQNRGQRQRQGHARKRGAHAGNCLCYVHNNIPP